MDNFAPEYLAYFIIITVMGYIIKRAFDNILIELKSMTKFMTEYRVKHDELKGNTKEAFDRCFDRVGTNEQDIGKLKDRMAVIETKIK